MYKKEFKGYSHHKFLRDLTAGLAAMVVNFPLALAIGESSGVGAAIGLQTAIMAGLILGLLSGGAFQIYAAAASSAVILSDVAAKYSLQGVFVCTVMVGFIILAMYLLKFDRIIEKIPKEVIVGVNAGIGLLLIAGELDQFLGITGVSGNVVEKFYSAVVQFPQTNWLSLGIGVLFFIILMVYPKKLNKFLPSFFFAVILAFVIQYFFTLPLECMSSLPSTIFGETFDFSSSPDIFPLILPSINLSFIVITKSISSGLSASYINKSDFSVKQELLAGGIGNIALGFLGCVPSGTNFSGTQVAIRTGAKTRITCIVNALGLLFAYFFFGQFLEFIPFVALSAMLIFAGVKMITKDLFKSIPAIATCIAMLFLDLSIAIFVGIGVYVLCGFLTNRKKIV